MDFRQLFRLTTLIVIEISNYWIRKHFLMFYLSLKKKEIEILKVSEINLFYFINFLNSI